MLFSMTGYGKAEKQINDKNIQVEIRSLNSKNLDLKMRIPSEYKEKEVEIRNLIYKNLKRGKVELNFNVEDLSDAPKNKIEPNIVKDYMEQLTAIFPELDKNIVLSSVLKMPDILKTDEKEFDEQEWKNILPIIEEAIQKLNNFRQEEGKSLEKDLRSNIDKIEKLLVDVSGLDENRIQRKKEKIRSDLEQLQTKIDENRFEQELIFYVEKFDINEEKVRLKNHLVYFIKELDENVSVKGKKLGFISQEIGREINTMGSKANDSEIQQKVVQMKDALEQIKEQVLNAV